MTNEQKENSLFEKPNLGKQDYSSEKTADRSSEEDKIHGWAKDDLGKHIKDLLPKKNDAMNSDEASYSSEDYNYEDSSDTVFNNYK